MSEIDDLMVDVGLTGGKRKKNTITYEQVGSKIPQQPFRVCIFFMKYKQKQYYIG